MANQREGFARGLRTCVDMLESMEMDECTIAGVTVLWVREDRPQDNAVRRTLDQVLLRGDPDELEGFCAALTDLAVTADECGDFPRMFSEMADRQLSAG
jgi:hypothetical protein